MSLVYVSKMSLGVLAPLALSVAGSLTVSINADIAALVLLSGNLTINPPTIGLNITALTALIAQLNAGISVGLPSIDFQATAVADAILELELLLSLPLSFALLLGGQAGIFLHAYDGITSGFGPAVTSSIGVSWPDGTSAAAPSNAIILGTVTGSVWDDMKTFFGAIPPSLATGLSYIASLNIGLLCPICIGATGPTIAELKARLDGLLALAIELSIHPPTFATSLQIALALKVALQAAVSIGLPSISFNIEAIAKLTATLKAHLSLLLKLTLSLTGVAGVFVYTYSGPGNQLGPSITSALAGGWPGGISPGSHANAIVLGTVQPAVWAIMSAFFGGI